MKNLNALIIIILLGIGIISCNKEEFGEVTKNESLTTNQFYLPISDALNIGLKQFEIRKEKNNTLKSRYISPDFRTKKIKEAKTFKKEGTDLFHIINYEGGGFVIISADKRVTPVLAYSESSEFDGEELPGISEWISAISTGILKAKKELKEPRDKELRLWEIYTGEKEIGPSMIEPDDPCSSCNTSWSISTGQFVDAVAVWTQGGQYSWYCPNDGGCSCDRKPAGCGPVAMAMVMNYYHYPNTTMTFNGETLLTNYPMPRTIPYNCNYPSDLNHRQVAMLIRLCGSFAGANYGVLGNCATWTYPGNINNALATMGFSNGGNWNGLDDCYQRVINDLKTYHPIILTGTLNMINLNDAHIWVADGYDGYRYDSPIEYYDEFGHIQCSCITYGRDMISMNWGHGGSGNGFYLANYSFTDGSGNTYDTYLRALTGIRP